MKTENKMNDEIKKMKEGQDFRLYLQDELFLRCSQNPNYSLRSFAKSLNISPSALSAMINEKRPITHKMKQHLGLKLKLNLDDLKKMKSSPHGNSKKTDSLDANNFTQITLDCFDIISEPFHYALLEFMKTNHFNWDSKWIAKRLDITVSEVNMAILRLERVGILDRNEDGLLFDTTNGFSTDLREGLSSEGQRRFQERSLEKSIAALSTIPVTQRDNTSITMAMNIEDLLLAKKLIKEFRRGFCHKLEENQKPNEVYQLTISFIPVTSIKGEEK